MITRKSPREECTPQTPVPPPASIIHAAIDVKSGEITTKNSPETGFQRRNDSFGRYFRYPKRSRYNGNIGRYIARNSAETTLQFRPIFPISDILAIYRKCRRHIARNSAELTIWRYIAASRSFAADCGDPSESVCKKHYYLRLRVSA